MSERKEALLIYCTDEKLTERMTDQDRTISDGHVPDDTLQRVEDIKENSPDNLILREAWFDPKDGLIVVFD